MTMKEMPRRSRLTATPSSRAFCEIQVSNAFALAGGRPLGNPGIRRLDPDVQGSAVAGEAAQSRSDVGRAASVARAVCLSRSPGR